MENSLGNQTYNDILQQYQGKVLPPDHPYTRMVKRVMARLIPLTGLPDEEWKVHVIQDDKNLNAFVLPG
jgi:metalloendopeptidase OMA1, mitochondrial